MDKKTQDKIWNTYDNNRKDPGIIKQLAKQYKTPQEEIRALISGREKSIKARRGFIGAGLTLTGLFILERFGLFRGSLDEVVSQEPAQYSGLTAEEIGKLPGVQRIVKQSGHNPQVVFIGRAHASLHHEGQGENYTTAFNSIETLCDHLYRGGFRAFIPEGMTERLASQYNSEGKIKLDLTQFPPQARSGIESLQRICNRNNFVAYPGESQQIRARLTREESEVEAVKQSYRQALRARYAQLMEQCYEREGPRFNITPENEQRLRDGVNLAIQEEEERASIQLARILNDDKMQRLYDIIVTERENFVLRGCRAAIGDGHKVIISYGATHTETLTQLMEENGIPYVAVLPRGISTEATLNASIESLRRSYALLPQGLSHHQFTGHFNEQGRFIFEDQ